MGRKRKNRRGHYCWSCNWRLPNEQFSGKGHARHLCKRCQKLGSEELQFRSGEREIDRLLDRGCGMIRRKDRPTFEKFLSHKNDRVRQYAMDIKKELDAVQIEEPPLGNELSDEQIYGYEAEEPPTESSEECVFDDDEVPF